MHFTEALAVQFVAAGDDLHPKRRTHRQPRHSIVCRALLMGSCASPRTSEIDKATASAASGEMNTTNFTSRRCGNLLDGWACHGVLALGSG
jgi:hypothetical protein